MPKHLTRSRQAPAAQLAGYALFLPAEAVAQRMHGPLARVADALNWSTLRDLLEPLAAEGRQRHGGPEGFDPLALTAATLLGRWHGLGDRALADALARRWDFMLFAGFDTGRPTPSAATLRRHVQRLERVGLLDVVFAEADAALAAAGFRVRPAARALVDVVLVISREMEAGT